MTRANTPLLVMPRAALVLALAFLPRSASAQSAEPAPSFPGQSAPVGAPDTNPEPAPPDTPPPPATSTPGNASQQPAGPGGAPSAAPAEPAQPLPTFSVTPLEPPAAEPPATRPAPARRSAPVAVGPQERCAESGPSRGIFKVGLPMWAAGLVAGGALGALALAGAGLVTAAIWNFAVFSWGLPGGPLQGGLILLLPAAGVLVGGVVGGALGALVAPFLPRLGLQKPCTQVQDGDPTQRPTQSSGGGGLNNNR